MRLVPTVEAYETWRASFDALGAARILDRLPWIEVLILLAALVFAAASLRKRSITVALLIFVGWAATTGGLEWFRQDLLAGIGAGRVEVLRAMLSRPGDPWPRGTAHVPLGRLGASEVEKGYLEPGGSFSPAAGTFGVSFWVVDQTGAVLATSDDIPIDRTSASYVESATGEPAIQVETPYFTARWTATDDGSFTLDLARHAGAAKRIDVVFRGVGPAGGPLRSIDGLTGQLRFDSNWTVEPIPSGAELTIGDEGIPNWMAMSASKDRQVYSATGWAFARVSTALERISLRLRNDARVVSTKLIDRRKMDLVPLRLDGADPLFVSALAAQIRTLDQGLVADQTRPGEPLNYPLEWLRDGAYVVVALARIGQIELAADLALAAAPKDFFGGFGAEADAPGLSLWMLGEVASAVRRDGFNREIWPHVARKANFILELLAAPSVVEHDFAGPVVPRYRGHPELRVVSYGTRGGLIEGRMDWHRPLFYINAASYAGLRAAASIAERLGKNDDAVKWSRAAEALKVAWRNAFDAPEMSADLLNDRTAISGLWPFSIANEGAFGNLMAQRWSKQSAQWDDPDYRPLWTYFSIAEAHQWLQLDRPDRARLIVDRLWSKTGFPGLFTLWEGRGEENTFGLWRSLRGWVDPPTVTPHYWSAAEMLLLQIAMLVEVRGEKADTLVIGSGVPPDWLSHGLHFAGLGTSAGRVSWSWDGREVMVTLPDDREIQVRLGSVFPNGTPVKIVREER